MYRKKECVVMLLAGGQGSRLYALTVKTAKPAVSFGGKYRIIDFPLSNCTNSKLDTVGVLTQYQPLMLNEYIGNGLSWDLNRSYGACPYCHPIRDTAVPIGIAELRTPYIRTRSSLTVTTPSTL